jgi:hypothetical protein
MIISDYIEFNNKYLFILLKEYIKLNPCCSVFPNCDHPKYQSGPNVFNIIDKNIDIIDENKFFELKRNGYKTIRSRYLNNIEDDKNG